MPYTRDQPAVHPPISTNMVDTKNIASGVATAQTEFAMTPPTNLQIPLEAVDKNVNVRGEERKVSEFDNV